MSTRLIRLLIGAFCALCFTFTASGQSLPAQAAVTLVVSDGSGSAAPCNTVGYATINDAIWDSTGQNTTILVCPGDYTEVIGFGGAKNFKLIGIQMDDSYPRILAPADVSDPTVGYGIIVTVVDSTNVTFQGFYVDGNGNYPDYADTSCANVANVPSCQMLGIYYANSTGIIADNYVKNIRRWPLGDDNYGIGIEVWAPSTKAVKITNNTVYDYQRAGIVAIDYAKATISKNYTFGFPTATSPILFGIEAIRTSGTSISGNTIRSTYGPADPNISLGVFLYGASKAKVTGNSIREMSTGVSIESYCYWFNGKTYPQANSNSISKNAIEDVATGVAIFSVSNASSQCNPQADQNKITGNTITSLLGDGVQGLRIDTQADGGTFISSAKKTTFTSNRVLGYSYLWWAYYDDPLQYSGLKDSKNIFTFMPGAGSALPAPAGGGVTKSNPADVPAVTTAAKSF